MGKDKVVIIVVITVVISAILFGILMAYRIYKLPFLVYSIEETISLLRKEVEPNDRIIMQKMYIYNEISRSNKIREENTNKVYEFSKEEMNELYKEMGGKEAVIDYLNNIKDKEEKIRELKEACYILKIITDEEYNTLLQTCF